jgi:hypothetical protein
MPPSTLAAHEAFLDLGAGLRHEGCGPSFGAWLVQVRLVEGVKPGQLWRNELSTERLCDALGGSYAGVHRWNHRQDFAFVDSIQV